MDFLTDQMQKAGNIRSRKMFGEYAVFCDEKVVALICDETLYVKSTVPGRTFLDESHESSPYPGAKNYLKVPEDTWDDPEWLNDFIRQTATALPFPNAKKKRKK